LVGKGGHKNSKSRKFELNGFRCWLAIATHEHALVEQAFENAKCAWLVKPALVATHGAGGAGASKRRSTRFAFVAKSIAVDLCCFFSTHAAIVVGIAGTKTKLGLNE
jgi:hypothetical protein